jgi:hypothetical protein
MAPDAAAFRASRRNAGDRQVRSFGDPLAAAASATTAAHTTARCTTARAAAARASAHCTRPRPGSPARIQAGATTRDAGAHGSASFVFGSSALGIQGADSAAAIRVDGACAATSAVGVDGADASIGTRASAATSRTCAGSGPGSELASAHAGSASQRAFESLAGADRAVARPRRT